MVEQAHILVVDDDASIRRMFQLLLTETGYRVSTANSGEEALAYMELVTPDLVLMDLMLPGISGQQVTERIKATPDKPFIPVILVTARNDPKSKVTALDAGAEDYLTKPFGASELLARIRVVLRRGGGTATPDVIQIGPIKIDQPRHSVTVDGRDVHLTPIEFRLLLELARQPGRVLTHRQLLREIWGPNAVEEVHYLRVHMASLRRKIEADPARPAWLITEAGVGYRLRPE